MEMTKENKMGTMSIPKLLYSISVPIIISMIVQALYNIVDSVYVAQFDPNAGTGALTIAFPIQNLMIAVSVGLAVGMNALLSRSLGQKNFDKANVIAGQGFFLTACGYALFLMIGLFFIKPFVLTQAEEGTLLYQYSTDYLSIVCVLSFGVFIQVVTERLLQATGKSFYSMIIQLSGAVVNIILDPILIFGWLGFPAMGVKGAAIATVVGQCIAGALGILLNLAVNKEIKLRLKNLLPKWELIKEMLAIGIPSVLMQAIGSVMTFSMNIILIGFGQTAMNVFGVYFKLQSFVFMPVFGLNNGMVPIVAYNFGAQKKDRVFATVKLGALTAVVYMLLGFAAFQLLPDVLLGFFNASPDMLQVGSVALRLISISFVFAGFSVVASCTCQALGKSIYSLIISIGRQLVVLIPAAFLLSLSGNVDLVWLAFPIAEIMSLLLCIFFLVRVLKKSFPKESA
ncbi:MAG: MATE family efflux transporter [Clostridia bacterium]|nr:MATE family efflux transporter [Clostridia bacterium]